MARQARGGDAKEARVGVGVVKGDARLDPAVLVEDVCVQTRVHALSGATGGEGAAAAEEGLEGGEGVDVVGPDGESLKGEVDVGKVCFGEGWGLGGEGEEATGVLGGFCCCCRQRRILVCSRCGK